MLATGGDLQRPLAGLLTDHVLQIGTVCLRVTEIGHLCLWQLALAGKPGAEVQQVVTGIHLRRGDESGLLIISGWQNQHALGALGSYAPVLVVMPQLRPLIARYARSFSKGLKVLSYNEIPEDLRVEVIGTLG